MSKCSLRDAVKGHLHCAVDLGQVTIGNHLRRLEADTNLETGWAPVNKLDSAFGFQNGNGAVDVIGHDVSTVQQAGGHVFSVAGIALHHLVVWFEARHRDFLHRVGLVGCLGSRDDGRVGHKREVDTWVWHQVGLELVEIDVE